MPRHSRCAPTLLVTLLSALLGLVAAAGSASAQRPITESGVWLDRTAPQPGSTVAGLVAVTGVAQLTEGITRIGVYVSEPGYPRTPAPVVEVVPSLPGVGEVGFALAWDTRALAGRLVDVRVVASGLLRSVEVLLPSVRVVAPGAAAPAPLPDPPTLRRRAVRDLPSPTARGPLPGVYLGGYGALPYDLPALRDRERDDATRLDVRPASAPAAPESGPWPAVAAGLLLLVVSAHVHRALRPQPGSEGPS